MRKPNLHSGRDPLESGTMTPMIDVVFLLLIFFVCAAVGQMREALVAADLPAGGIASVTPPPEEPVLGRALVSLRSNAQGQTVAELNGTTYVDLAELEAQLREIAAVAPEIPVILDIGEDVEFGDVMSVYDTCRSAQFQAVNFAVDPRHAAAGAP